MKQTLTTAICDGHRTFCSRLDSQHHTYVSNLAPTDDTTKCKISPTHTQTQQLHHTFPLSVMMEHHHSLPSSLDSDSPPAYQFQQSQPQCTSLHPNEQLQLSHFPETGDNGDGQCF